MTRLIKKISKTIGLPPGTLVHVGEEKTEKVRITLIDYDETNIKESKIESIEDVFSFKDKPTVTWVNIDGVHRTDIIQKIDTHFGIHPLVLEDIVNTGQRPKMEDYGDYLFVVLKMMYCEKEGEDIIFEQVSIILGPNYVISFQEKEGDVFEAVRERIRGSKGRIRKMGADYLAYSLLDAIIDNYFVILEQFGMKIEELEDKLLGSVDQKMARSIHDIKRNMIFLRKQIWPLREVISGFQRNESKLIKKATGIYLRDVYDHTIQVIDTIESFRDTLSGLHDIYLSSISNRMNEIMKVLTIFAAIFIPLTFMAGIYGMNFEFMPELKWKYGYFILLGLMAFVGIGLAVYFKKKKWL